MKKPTSMFVPASSQQARLATVFGLGWVHGAFRAQNALRPVNGVAWMMSGILLSAGNVIWEIPVASGVTTLAATLRVPEAPSTLLMTTLISLTILPGRHSQHCGCRLVVRLGQAGVLVFVEDAVETISPMDVQVPDLSWLGDRSGQRTQRCGLNHGPLRPVSIVERFELT
jgi:hypothetical protein